MKKSTNAILLSAFAFPGTGHLYLKKTKTGLTLIAITIIALIYTTMDITDRASRVVEQIQSGYTPVDTDSTMKLVEQQPGGEWVGVASFVIVGCWVIGIVGCYLAGKKTSN